MRSLALGAIRISAAQAAPALHFPHLTALRGVAAMMVLWFHVIMLNWRDFPVAPDAMRLLHYGWVGVDLFFVLSGFVVTLSALQLYGQGPDLSAARRIFLRRRLARLAPLYMLTTLVALLTVQSDLLRHPDFWAHFLSHAALVHNLHPGTNGSINGPSWSVGVEMQFYLLIALAMPWLPRLKGWHVLIGGVAFAWLARGGLFALAEARHWPEPWRIAYGMQVPSMMDGFAVGIGLALGVKQGWFIPGKRRDGFLLVLAGCATLYLAFLLLWRLPEYWFHASTFVFWRSIPALCFGAIVAGAILLPAGKGPVQRGMHYLGEISYGIYLWHFPVILLLKQCGIAKENPAAFGAGVVALTLCLAATTWHGLEKPAIRQWR